LVDCTGAASENVGAVVGRIVLTLAPACGSQRTFTGPREGAGLLSGGYPLIAAEDTRDGGGTDALPGYLCDEDASMGLLKSRLSEPGRT
jgi:hypothetical protein